ncbi:putative aspartate kinase [Capsicum annuum]|uniref:rRNA-processing protein CGR1 n=1 Tax=Capsicum annuum TaxID=4072 RepID=UPI001FB142DF|nr:rRNA-processing protein CGR1 [Capsicum annuum]KAF3621906.1 putative aspartate kinase [Capsicum annuum]
MMRYREAAELTCAMACTVDFRCLDEGFGGKTYKRKRAEKELNVPTEEEGDGMAMEVEVSKRQAVPSSADPNKPVLGRPTYDGVIAGRVSGRNWKQPRKHRSSASKVSVKGKSLEQRMKEKEMKKAYRERMNELKEEIRQNKVNKRKHKEERDKKKQENILKSGTKVQKITNPKTLKKIAKSKQRKLLKVVSDQTKTIN